MPYKLNPITGQLDYFSTDLIPHNHDERYYSKTKVDEEYYSKTKVDELISGLLKGSLDPILETLVIEG